MGRKADPSIETFAHLAATNDFRLRLLLPRLFLLERFLKHTNDSMTPRQILIRMRLFQNPPRRSLQRQFPQLSNKKGGLIQ
jgi:hypothetical protein